MVGQVPFLDAVVTGSREQELVMNVQAFNAIIVRWSENSAGRVDAADALGHFKQLDVMILGSCDDDVGVGSVSIHSHADHIRPMTSVQLAYTIVHTQVPEANNVSRGTEEEGAMRRQSNVQYFTLALAFSRLDARSSLRDEARGVENLDTSSRVFTRIPHFDPRSADRES